MPQSLAQLYTHLIFSTKHREPNISPAMRDQLAAYIGGTMRGIDSPTIAVGVVADHVHVFYRQSKNRTLAKTVEELKTSTSKWMKSSGGVAGFYWQNGYGAFSVSASKFEAVKEYVLRQEEHHKTESFQDEFRLFLREYRIDYDEQYVWD